MINVHYLIHSFYIFGNYISELQFSIEIYGSFRITINLINIYFMLFFLGGLFFFFFTLLGTVVCPLSKHTDKLEIKVK